MGVSITFRIKDNIITVSRMPILPKGFSLEYALASSLAFSMDTLLSPEGNYQIDEATNTIIVSDKKKNLEEIANFIREIDIPVRQLQSKSFTIKFIPVDKIVFLLKDYLSSEGKIEVDLSANTLILTETKRNFTQLEELILDSDVYQPKDEIFTLKYALAPSVASLLEDSLGPEDKMRVNEQTNEIIVSSSPYALQGIKRLLSSLDTPDRQTGEKSFSAKYLYLEELASLVEEELSSLGEIKIGKDKEVFIVKDSLYSLSKIEKLIKERDVFIPSKRTYEINFASLSSLAEEVEGLLSDKGNLEIKEKTHSLAIVDVKKNLEKIDELIEKEDNLENQGSQVIWEETQEKVEEGEERTGSWVQIYHLVVLSSES